MVRPESELAKVAVHVLADTWMCVLVIEFLNRRQNVSTVFV